MQMHFHAYARSSLNLSWMLLVLSTSNTCMLMIHLLLFLMLSVWRILLGNNIISRMRILWKLTNYAFPSLLFVCYFCKRLMEADSWDTSDVTRRLLPSLRTIFGPRCFETSHASPPNALHVTKLSLKLNLMAFICHFLSHIIHGKDIGIDFVLGFLRNRNGKDFVFVVVD